MIPSPVPMLPPEVIQAFVYIAHENYNLFISKEYADYPPANLDEYCCDEEDEGYCAGTSLLCCFTALAAVIAFMKSQKRRSP